MSIEEARRVFDALWSHADAKRRPLAVARAIVDAHGGRTWVESAPGSGAAYCFALPLPVSNAA